ncbi:MAG: hypothetical protein HOH65_01180 [Rhodospirillaceae bacterium]|nr:hypothetical protein [Rhodospirillaceae bacterium]
MVVVNSSNLKLMPVVYLSVENRSRELSSKLLVACELADRGLTVIIGQQWLLNENLRFSPKGVVVFKGLNKVQTHNMGFAINLGHMPVSNDEEALGVAKSFLMTKDVDPEAGLRASRIFTLGEVHQRELMRHTGLPERRLPITGNPRLDLLRPEFLTVYDDEVAEIRAEHGPFVLINTNSAGVNSGWGSTEEYRNVLIRIGWIDPENEDDNILLEEHLEYDRKNMREIETLISEISTQMPGQRIVLRPHPSEDPQHWIDVCADKPAVTIVPRSDHIPWMMACEAMVNTGCTTGVEGQMMGVRTMSLCPDETRWHSFYLANQVNLRVKTAADATGVLKLLRTGTRDLFAETREQLMAVMHDNIGAIDDRYAFEQMAEAIAKSFPMTKLNQKIPEFWNDPGYLTELTRPDYLREKMTIGEAEIRTQINGLRKAAGKPHDFDIRTLGDSLFMMSSDRGPLGQQS